jgi:anaerobic selenocysteine-containing dehydrogenase
MHTRDAAALNLNNGDRIVIEADSGRLELLLRVADNMTTGIVLVPRHCRLNWQIFGTGRVVIGKERIKKVASD